MEKITKKKQITQISQLKSWRNYVVFIAISASLTNIAVMAFSWWSLLVLGLWLVRLLYTRQVRLLVGCFLVVGISAGYFTYVKEVEKRDSQAVNLVSTNASLKSGPGDLQIEGDLLTLTGTHVVTNQRYLLHYRIKSEAEQASLAALTKLTKFDLEIELKERPTQRNLNGFDYGAYLMQERIFYFGTIKRIVSYEYLPMTSITAVTSAIKGGLRHSFNQRLPRLSSHYLAQLILGLKDPSLKTENLELNLLGIGRLLTLSGLQVYYFLRLFRYVCLRLGVTIETHFYLELALLMSGLLLFWGQGLGVIRALLISLIKNVNQRWERHLSSLDCWSLVLLVCLVIKPSLWLRADGQLTFLLSYAWLALKLENGRVTYVKKHLLISLLATPLLAYHFYEWHLGSIFLSLLVLPLVVYLIWPSLGLTWLLTFFWENLPWLGGLEKLLDLFNRSLSVLAQQSWLTVATGAIPLLLLASCLALAVLLLMQLQEKETLNISYLVIIVCLPWGFKYVNPLGIVAFVDVGQGDAMLVQRPFYRGSYLIDVGGQLSFPKEEWAQHFPKEQQLTNFLKSRGIKKIERVFLTHGHVDHLGNIGELGETFKIEEIVFPSGMLRVPYMASHVKKLQVSGTDLEGVLSGGEWQLGKELTIRSLAPSRAGLGENADSLVLQLEFKHQRMLQMGDLEAVGEAELLADNQELNHDILGVGHHGSRSSSTLAFVKAVQPKVAVMSLGRNNLYQHPHQEALANLSHVQATTYRTDLNGMIYFKWYAWNQQLSEAQTIR